MGEDRTGKQPYAIALADRSLMALAGLWENWNSPEGEWMRSFAIITTTPNELCARLHNRMPVVLKPEAWPVWLGEEFGRGIRAQGPADADPFGRDDLLARERAGRERQEQRCEPDRTDRCLRRGLQPGGPHRLPVTRDAHALPGAYG